MEEHGASSSPCRCHLRDSAADKERPNGTLETEPFAGDQYIDLPHDESQWSQNPQGCFTPH
jgi:hypothetical protein